MLLRIIGNKTASGKTLFMAVCEDGESLDIVLNGVLDIKDIYNLCKVKDNAQKTAFWYILNRIESKKEKKLGDLYSSKELEEEPPYAVHLINTFVGNEWLLIKLLNQKSVDGQRILYWCCVEQIYHIYNVINSYFAFNELIKNQTAWKNYNMKQIGIDYANFYRIHKLDFAKILFSFPRTKGITPPYWDNLSNPILAACKFREHDILKRYFADFFSICYKSQYKKMLTKSYGHGPEASLVGHACDAKSSTDNGKDLGMLNLLVLQNEWLTNEEKFECFEKKYEESTFFTTSTQYIRLKMLQYISMTFERKELLKLLTTKNEGKEEETVDTDKYRKDPWKLRDKITFNFITLKSPKQVDADETKSLLRFILDHDKLEYEDKMQMLMHEYKIVKEVYKKPGYTDEFFKDNSARKACADGYGSVIIGAMKKKELMNFMNPDHKIRANYYKKQTPLMLIAMSEYKDEDVIRMLFEESALTKEDVKILMTTRDEDGYTAMYYAVNNWNHKFVYHEMIKYLKKIDIKLLVDILLIKCSDYNGNNTNIGQLVSKDNVELEHFMVLFTAIDDDELLDKLVNSRKNKEFQSLYDIQDKKWTRNYNTEQVQELILEVVDYIKFVKKLNDEKMWIETVFDGNTVEYMTNPFLTACKLGRFDTIKKVLMYVKEVKTERDLRELLLNNYDKMTGQKCLMVLYENGYYKYIMNVLNFLKEDGSDNLKEDVLCDRNSYNQETLMIQICKKEENGDIIGQVVDCIGDKGLLSKLMEQKDFKQNCALDYAKQQVYNVVNDRLQ